jgi:NADH-quinone oxidoreductase subunit M
VIFSAVYALTLYRNVMFGEITNPAMKAILDVDKREILIFTPLILGTILLGVQPGLVLTFTDASAHALTSAYQLAIGG